MRVATLLAVTALAAPCAWSAPAPLAPGASVAIPTFTGSTPTVTVLGDVMAEMTANGMTVNFEEFAVQTSLNPGGVSFAFDLTTSNNPTALGAMLAGFGGFMTSVESCDPLTSSPMTCGTATGTAARSSGSGDLLTFSALGTSPVSIPGGPTIFVSNVYGIFTDASGFTKGTDFTVNDDGTTFSFKGLGPAASSVPEPGTLALLSLGFLGVAAARRRRLSA